MRGEAIVFCGLLFCAACVPQADDAPANPYGTTSHLTRTGYSARDGLCSKFGGAGAKWMRMDFDWRVLERKPGEWNFSRYDDILSCAESNGVQVVGILGSPPERYKRVWEHVGEWSGFARTVAERYRGRIPVYEVWNEQDAKPFWGFEPNVTNYAAILKASYETLKAVDPTVRVAVGAFTKNGLAFCEGLYRLGAARWFDVMNVHPYPRDKNNPWPEGDLDVQLEKFKSVMSRYGDAGKEIWITEIGIPAPWKPRFAVPGILKDGLAAIDGKRKTWRTLVVDQTFARPKCGGALVDLVTGELPQGSVAEGCGFENLASSIKQFKPDLVVMTPRSQDYPSDGDEAIVDFVRRGGVVADMGGMPFYSDPRGAQGKYRPWQLRQTLHFEAQGWWNKNLPQVPKEIKVFPTVSAPSVKCGKDGITAMRFISDRFLKPGDQFTPLLKATWTNGVECVAAASILHSGGGGVVLSGIIESVLGIYSEYEQAVYLPRTHLTAFASGVSTVMWYELRSHDFDWHDDGWGMLHADLTEKASWSAYRTLVAMRPAGSVALSAVTAMDGVCHHAWKRPDGRRAGAIWTAGSPQKTAIDLGGGKFDFVDFLGRRIEPEKVDGKWVLDVSGEVVYYSAR